MGCALLPQVVFDLGLGLELEVGVLLQEGLGLRGYDWGILMLLW